jgi:hypothetical protein
MKLGLIAFIVAIGFSAANTCGGNCPSDDCPSCPCGTSVSYVDIAQLCARYTGWSQTCCQCIVYHESKGMINAANYNTDSSFDVGAFQINEVNWGECNGGATPCDLNSNLKCAIQIWGWGGDSFRYWSTSAICGGC